MKSSEMRTVRYYAILLLGVMALAVASRTASADSADLAAQLAAAKESLQKAQAEEKAAADEVNARDMARAATREIVVAARDTVTRADAALREDAEVLKQKTAAAKAAADALAAEQDPNKRKALEEQAAKAAAERDAAEKSVAERTDRVKVTNDRLVVDSGVADRASADFDVVEKKWADRILGTTMATGKVLAIEAQIARSAAETMAAEKAAAEKALGDKKAAEKAATDQAVAETDAAKKTAALEAAIKSVAERAATEKAAAEKTVAAKAAADKLAAAETAVRQHEAAMAWDVAEWAAIELARAEQQLQQKTAAAQAAAQQAAAEPDAAKKKPLDEAAAKAAAERDAFAKQVANQRAAVEADRPKVYAMRVVALGGLKPLAPECWDYAKARHLLVRAGFGGTPQEVEKLRALGLYKAVDYLVDFYRQPAPNVPFEAAPPAPPTDPLEAKLRMPGVRGRVGGERAAGLGGDIGALRRAWLKRMVESQRPLQEKLTLFWHGHFATQISVVGNTYATYYQNQLFREHAAGSFGGLLYGLVHDPVMIRFLDNNTNVKGHANENLAREIMELFAMGVDQGYTEKDIREAARALTGYTFDVRTGHFRFVANQHDEGPKTVFGQTGNWTGDDLVNLILQQPSTSRLVARKLFEFFAYQDPGSETVDQLAAVLRTHNYELNPMLKNLFLSEEFYGPKATGTQIKCPVQLVVGTLRDLGVKQIADAGVLDGATQQMGQTLFEPPDVKGWRYGRSWINTDRVFVRYNSVANLVRSVPQPGRQGVDVVAMIEGGGCKNSGEVVDYLAKACLANPLSGQKREKLVAFVGELPPPTEWAKQRDALNPKLQTLLVMMMSLPDYQFN